MERPVTKPGAVRAIRESEIVSPAEMIAVGDAVLSVWGGSILNPQYVTFGVDDLSWGIRSPSQVTPSYRPEWRKRHAGRWNVLFCDGHVRTMRPGELFAPRFDKVRRIWNKDNQPHREFPPVTHIEPERERMHIGTYSKSYGPIGAVSVTRNLSRHMEPETPAPLLGVTCSKVARPDCNRVHSGGRVQPCSRPGRLVCCGIGVSSQMRPGSAQQFSFVSLYNRLRMTDHLRTHEDE